MSAPRQQDSSGEYKLKIGYKNPYETPWYQAHRPESALRPPWYKRWAAWIYMAVIYIQAVYDDICWYWYWSKDYGSNMNDPYGYNNRRWTKRPRRWEHKFPIDQLKTVDSYVQERGGI